MSECPRGLAELPRGAGALGTCMYRAYSPGPLEGRASVRKRHLPRATLTGEGLAGDTLGAFRI